MLGTTILLLLACGGLAVQGYRGSNSNVNSNSNVFSRRSPTPGALPSYLNDNIFKTPDGVYNDEDDDDDSRRSVVGGLAADGVVYITRTLIHELGEPIAMAIAECIAKVIRDTYRRSGYEKNLELGDSDGSDTSNEPDRVAYADADEDDISNLNDEDEDEGNSLSRRRWDRFIRPADYPRNSNINSNTNVNTNINQNSFRRSAVRRQSTDNRAHSPWDLFSRKLNVPTQRPTTSTYRPPGTIPMRYQNGVSHL